MPKPLREDVCAGGGAQQLLAPGRHTAGPGTFLDVCRRALPQGWKEEWKLSFLKVKLSTRLRSGRTAGGCGLPAGIRSWGRALPVGAKEPRGEGQELRFSPPRFPPRLKRRLKSGYSTPWLGLPQPQTDSIGSSPCTSFMHLDFKVWRSSVLESRAGGGERRKCRDLAHGGLGPTESRPGAAPRRLPPGNTPSEGVYTSGGEEGSAQETQTQRQARQSHLSSPVDGATCPL